MHAPTLAKLVVCPLHVTRSPSWVRDVSHWLRIILVTSLQDHPGHRAAGSSWSQGSWTILDVLRATRVHERRTSLNAPAVSELPVRPPTHPSPVTQDFITILDVLRVTEPSVGTPIINMLVDSARVGDSPQAAGLA